MTSRELQGDNLTWTHLYVPHFEISIIATFTQRFFAR